MGDEHWTANFLRGRRGGQIRPSERAALETALSAPTIVPARSTIVKTGEVVDYSTFLIDGFMCRYMDDRAGHRQLVALHVPGDFVDLHAFPLKRLDHDVATVTQCRIATVPHTALIEMTSSLPHLMRMLWFSTLLDAAMHREWIFRLGRLDALGRVVHFLLESDERLQAVGLSDGKTFRLPLTQMDIAEACGLTAIHVNRVFRELREEQMLIFDRGHVSLLDRDSLVRASEFDPQYLYYADDILTP